VIDPVEPAGDGEWLLANGLGGYALGPRRGPPTRGYHGWLVAATRPPDGRVLLVGAIETTLSLAGIDTRLDELELSEGRAVRHGAAITLAAVMPRGANATVLTWRRLDDGLDDARLSLAPLFAGRDHHPVGGTCQAPSTVAIAEDARSATVAWSDPALPVVRVATDRGRIRPARREVPVDYPDEAARGTPAAERLHVALEIVADMPRDASVTVVIGTGAGGRASIPTPEDGPLVARAAAARDADLVSRAGIAGHRALVLAADRFLALRPDPALPDPDDGMTVIAGYPWFGDWGRDTMISLPGLTLATGRHEIAARILRTWAGLVRDGLLPNHFPEAGRGQPAYHAIDAPLWFVHAVAAYELATGDRRLPAALRPAVEAIIGAYRDGTRFGIGMDPADGLVRGGEPGLQLTWMDARVDGTVITPRHGKPVEIQALWIAALRHSARWADAAGEAATASAHRAGADRAAASFRARYFLPGHRWLADVIDGPDGDDASLRPNQLLAMTLVDDLVDADQAAAILDAVERHLLVPGGVRTLAPFEPAYRDRFQGPPGVRDAAYHQGPAWTWLLGPWLDAVERHRGEKAARTSLAAALRALDPGETGAVPELLEPEPPHASRGCPWQAWGVAELLRCAARLR
jgi:glycogen debranching enzyme